MKTVWFATSFVKSTLPLTERVPPVMSFKLIIVQDDEPLERTVRDLVSSHTRNCVLIAYELEKGSIPDGIL